MELNIELKEYDNFTKFIQDVESGCRKNNPKWSYSWWAMQMGLKDRTQLQKIVSGSRSPSKNLIKKIAKYLDLSDEDFHHLNSIVAHDKLRKQGVKEVFINANMSAATKNVRKKRVLRDDEIDLLGRWEYALIREMVVLNSFKENSDWIQSMMKYPIKKTEIETILMTLLKSGLVYRDSHGNLVQSEMDIETPNEIKERSATLNYFSLLDLAKNSLLETPQNEREFSGVTFTMDSNDFEDAKMAIRDFKIAFAKKFEKAGGDVTIQLQLQMFPLTK